jgi:PKD repeat protein
MKKLHLLLGILAISIVQLFAQNNTDLVISGYVTSENGLAIANHEVCVNSFPATSTFQFSGCAQTNANGWYSIIVPNGSVVGPNIQFLVSTLSCNNTVLDTIVMNAQGTIPHIQVNFVICQNTTNCSAHFTYQWTSAANTIQFLSSFVGTPTSNYMYSWSFGDGSGSNLPNPIHTFAHSGTYHVCLTVTSSTGCTDTYCSTITIGQTNPCDIGFTYTTGLNYGITFTPIVPGVTTDIQYLWHFGDGTSSTNAIPTHSYNASGYYNVCLTVHSALMTCTYCDSIFVQTANNCSAAFIYHQVSNTNTYKFFGSNSTSPIPGYTYHWDFGDGNQANIHNPQHTFSQPGTYEVCLTVTTTSGCTDTFCVTIIVSGGTTEECDVTFTFQQTSAANGFAFHGYVNPQANVVQWHWDFGDNTTSNIQNPYHMYTNPGVYNVCLTITTATGCTNTYCSVITIGQTNPCNISFTYTTAQNLGITFTPVVPTGTTNAQYLWHFGDGTSSTNATPTHSYNASGYYNVCLTVHIAGMTCTYCDSIFVQTANTCTAAFIFHQITNTNTFKFFGSNSTSPIPGYTYHWDLGDGHESNIHNPQHTFSQPGTYEVCLTITTTTGCTDTHCKTIIISGGTTETCSVTFTYQGTASNGYAFLGHLAPQTNDAQWYWDFGDNTTSNIQNPYHIYNSPGTYTVCLTVYSSHCDTIVTYCQQIHVTSCNNVCPANFTYTQSAASVHFFVANTNPTIGNCLYHWDFGDGTTSTLPNPTHVYSTSGVYVVCLVVSQLNGNCQNTYCQNVIIGANNTCQASYTYTYGSGNQVAFYPNLAPISTSIKLSWDFGDGNTSSGYHPVHTYTNSGTYTVCLTVQFPNCPAVTYCDTIVIQNNTNTCNAYFTYQINNAAVYFYAVSSTVAPNPNIIYSWDFGNGITSNVPNPVITFMNYGTYTVCLTITNTLTNCTDEYCQTITIGQNGFFGGQIFAGDNFADAGTVYLLTVLPATSNGIIYVASTPILENGQYLFENIPYGNYIVQAHLSHSSVYFFDYLPTYYGDVLYWSQATFVSVGEVGLTVQYDIHLIGTNIGGDGPGGIGGNVIIDEGPKTEISVENVLIILLDAENNPVTYTYSDANGSFLFENLPLGTYKLFAEIWGKEPIPSIITLTDEHHIIDNVSIMIHEDYVITYIPSKEFSYIEFISNPYPNPAQDNISIEIGLKQAVSMHIRIYNSIGQMVFEQNADKHAGVHRIQIPVNALNQGIYFISLHIDNTIRWSRAFSKL